MAKRQETWFGYDWEVRGEPARFLVDTAYAEPAAGFETLLFMAVSAPDPNAMAFSPREVRRLGSVERRLMRALRGGIYVGDIDMKRLRQYYFYVQDEAQAMEAAQALADKEKVLSLSPGAAAEPDWLTYHELLMPDAAKYQTELNRELIEKHRKHGDYALNVRRLTLLVGFPTEQTRLLFQEKARLSGFAIGDPQFKTELDHPHVLPLFALSSLEKSNVDQLTTSAIRLASSFGGELVRWNAPVVPKRSPLA